MLLWLLIEICLIKKKRSCAGSVDYRGFNPTTGLKKLVPFAIFVAEVWILLTRKMTIRH